MEGEVHGIYSLSGNRMRDCCYTGYRLICLQKEDSWDYYFVFVDRRVKRTWVFMVYIADVNHNKGKKWILKAKG